MQLLHSNSSYQSCNQCLYKLVVISKAILFSNIHKFILKPLWSICLLVYVVYYVPNFIFMMNFGTFHWDQQFVFRKWCVVTYLCAINQGISHVFAWIVGERFKIDSEFRRRKGQKFKKSNWSFMTFCCICRMEFVCVQNTVNRKG